MKSKQRKVDCRQRYYPGYRVASVTSCPKQESAEDPYCQMPKFTVFLLESTRLTLFILFLWFSLLLYFILTIPTCLQNLWPGKLSFNWWDFSLLNYNPILWFSQTLYPGHPKYSFKKSLYSLVINKCMSKVSRFVIFDLAIAFEAFLTVYYSFLNTFFHF